jgi:hypothetical protein
MTRYHRALVCRLAHLCIGATNVFAAAAAAWSLTMLLLIAIGTVLHACGWPS